MSYSSTSNYEAPFRLLHKDDALEIGVGMLPSYPWGTIADCRLLIIVGVTGVGKSTTVNAMAERDIEFSLLPNRRTLTDKLIIAQMQEADGDVVEIERDRRKRFAYTRHYQRLFAGGMAHALSQLLIKRNSPQKLLLFDGLRGVNEIESAVQGLPNARFLALTAPDLERLQRLCGRNDAFDQIGDRTINNGISKAEATPLPNSRWQGALPGAILKEAGLEPATELFKPSEIEGLATMVTNNKLPLDLLRSKLAIVSEERRNYDPAETVGALRAVAGERALIVDTTQLVPNQIAGAVAERLADWWR